MELGDIIYILVLFSFFIFGIIKDIKKKEASKHQNLPPNVPTPETIGKKVKSATTTSQKKRNKAVTPPIPEIATTGNSMTSSFALEGSSSIQERNFSYKNQDQDDNSFISNNRVHPILKELTGENRSEELRKAVIYNEIINRKY